MGKRETSFLGAITMRVLQFMSQEDAGWLIQALIAWILEDKQPNPEDVPDTCWGAWVAICEESKAIHEAKKERSDAKSEAGKAGNAIRWNRKASQSIADGRSASQSIARARAGLELELDKDKEYTADVTLSREEDEPADNGTAVETSHSSNDNGDERIKETSFEAWARLQPDPVAVALDVTGEGQAKKGIYGKRLRKLGKDRFLDVVCGFRAQVAAGETVRNPGAALTAQLNEAVTAMEVCAG